MWSHKKHGKKWKGSYKTLDGHRVFVLKKEGKRNKEFDGWQLAKRDGWIKDKK